MEITPASGSKQGPAAMFTGEVWFDVIAAPPAPSRLRVNRVRFAPLARTHWHVHAAGQTLHVTQGLARVGTRDGRTLELRPGQTLWCPPGEWHWHGAAPETFMEHLAMWETTNSPSGSETTWGEPVTDERYHRPEETDA